MNLLKSFSNAGSIVLDSTAKVVGDTAKMVSDWTEVGVEAASVAKDARKDIHAHRVYVAKRSMLKDLGEELIQIEDSLSKFQTTFGKDIEDYFDEKLNNKSTKTK